jgi:ribosome-binding ATPase YchF (GTP1/OBG family)
LLDELRNEIITGIKKDLSDELNKKIEEISKSVSANISIKEDAEKLKNILSKFTTILENNFLSGESSLKTNEEILSNIDKKIDLFLNKKVGIIINKFEERLNNELYKNDELVKKIDNFVDISLSNLNVEREKLKVEFKELTDKLNILSSQTQDLLEEIPKDNLEPKYLQKLFEISNKLVQIYSEFKVILELKNDEK